MGTDVGVVAVWPGFEGLDCDVGVFIEIVLLN
jgi:hypothetical protein